MQNAIPRRDVLASIALIGSATATSPVLSLGASRRGRNPYPDYSPLDEALKRPVLKRELFSAPVIIDTIELLQDRNNFICRVRSKEGAQGVSIGHPFISKQGYPMFEHCVRHRFFDSS